MWAVCLPLAILIGFLLAEPQESGSLAVLVLLATVLSVPLLFQWHHPLLVFTWNAAIMPTFLPGTMSLWMAIAAASFTFAILNRATSDTNRFMCPRSVTAALIFLLVVMAVTMAWTGGMGVRVLNSAKYGGKGYFYILFAILGFFGLVSQRIPPHRAILYAGLFFFSGITEAVSNLIYMLGPKAYPLFHIFPAGQAMSQAASSGNLAVQSARIGGFGMASVAVVTALLVVYGVRGLLEIRKPWRGLLLILALVVGAQSGFRSLMLLCLLSIAAAFFFEGLHRTRLMVVCLLILGLAGLMLAVFSTALPSPMQRALSFFPIEVDQSVRQDAQASVEWRVDMWKDVLPEVRKHSVVGKGYLLDPTDIDLTDLSVWRGLTSRWGAAALSGEYHSGPLTLVIPLGGLGVVAFVWFLVAGGRALYLNYRHGDPRLVTINRFLFAYFLVRIFHYVFVFGSFYLDFFIFTGIVGLGLSLNGGVSQPDVVGRTEDEDLAWSRFQRNEQRI